MAQQLKGVVMPYVESQKGEKALIVSSKAKRFAAYGALRRVGSQFFFECLCVIENQWKSNLLQFKNVQMVICSCFPHRNAPWHATGVSVPRRPRKLQRMLLLLARSKMYHYSKQMGKNVFYLLSSQCV